jgi:hypothetical protein
MPSRPATCRKNGSTAALVVRTGKVSQGLPAFGEKFTKGGNCRSQQRILGLCHEIDL